MQQNHERLQQLMEASLTASFLFSGKLELAQRHRVQVAVDKHMKALLSETITRERVTEIKEAFLEECEA
eukprot:1749432-Lingulodinium_polyedra.AAC.1